MEIKSILARSENSQLYFLLSDIELCNEETDCIKCRWWIKPLNKFCFTFSQPFPAWQVKEKKRSNTLHKKIYNQGTEDWLLSNIWSSRRGQVTAAYTSSSYLELEQHIEMYLAYAPVQLTWADLQMHWVLNSLQTCGLVPRKISLSPFIYVLLYWKSII